MFYINRLYQPYNQLNIASISEMMKQGEKATVGTCCLYKTRLAADITKLDFEDIMLSTLGLQ